MTRTEQARSLFQKEFVCSQAVLATFAPDLGLDEETALRVAAAFGGGIARTARTCGAVTGALMVIGLRHGTTDPHNQAARAKTYAKAHEFIQRFERRHGSIECKDLLGLDIGTPEGYSQAKDTGLFERRCPLLVKSAVEILEQL